MPRSCAASSSPFFSAVAGLSYVYLKNQLYVCGIQRKALEQELNELISENNVMETQISNLTSRAALQRRMDEGFMKLVPITNQSLVRVHTQDSNRWLTDGTSGRIVRFRPLRTSRSHGVSSARGPRTYIYRTEPHCPSHREDRLFHDHQPGESSIVQSIDAQSARPDLSRLLRDGADLQRLLVPADRAPD